MEASAAEVVSATEVISAVEAKEEIDLVVEASGGREAEATAGLIAAVHRRLISEA